MRTAPAALCACATSGGEPLPWQREGGSAGGPACASGGVRDAGAGTPPERREGAPRAHSSPQCGRAAFPGLWAVLIRCSWEFERSSAYPETGRRHVPPPPNGQPGPFSIPQRKLGVVAARHSPPRHSPCFKISWLPKRVVAPGCLWGVVPARCRGQGEE